MSRPNRSATAFARRAASALALCLAFAGCITTPLERREWYALRTPHYDIWSSLGEEDTARLGVELERFRAAAAFIWGAPLPSEPMRTQVYAFDDRGLGRPFAYQYQRSYLLARQRGDVIVLRTGGSWEDDAWTPLKLAYARRLFWNASQEAAPPWLDEGLPQLASTLEIRGPGATVGILQSDHVRALRREQWVPFNRLLAASDLSGWSSNERELFEAESWALCHYLLIGKERRDEGHAELSRFRALLAEGATPEEAARTALGENLQNPVWQHVRATELDSFSVKIQRVGGASPTRREVAQREVLEQLGSLSLAIGEAKQGRAYYEKALEFDAQSPGANAGLGEALAALGDLDGAQARYQAALDAAPEDPLVHLGHGHVSLARARASQDPAARADLVRDAREHYQHSLALAGALPEAYVGIAQSFLVDGEDPAAGTEAWRAARALLPGDPAIESLGVELALARGDRAAARRGAARLHARARSTTEIAAADALFGRIDARADAR